MPNRNDLVASPFQDKPCYRYIRKADKLPIIIGPNIPFDKIVCPVRLFNPTGAGTWWIASYDPVDDIAWGIAEISEREVGSFFMAELVAFRGSRFPLPIERDLYWKPKTIMEILSGNG